MEFRRSDRTRSGRGRGRVLPRGRGFNNRRGQPNGYQNGGSGFNTFEANGEMNAHLTERFGARGPRKEEIRGFDSSNSDILLDLNPHIAEYVRKQHSICESADKDDWRSMPEIPSSSEICLEDGNTISLPRNKIDKPWSKNERYLKAHYKLLREDATAPLREALGNFRKDPQRMDDNDLRIYEQVRVVGLTFSSKGIASRIRFSTARAGRKILWSSSKRLTSGTLVALTPTHDEFRTQCILAIVAARPLANLEVNPPEVDILFGDMDSHEVDPQQTFIMIEATQGYYEAYRHTLRALQKQSTEAFPLSEHICKLQDEIGPPDYLAEKPRRDLVPAAADDKDLREAFRNVDLLNEWPVTPSTSLEKTQWKAMREILTKKLAIIQGPPGTGKTHISKIAIEILLRNRSLDDPPIIMACQTNHALDQLLEHVSKFEPFFIRLGGRSSNQVVKQRALFEIRKREIIEDVKGSGYGKARRDISTETMKLKSLLSPVKDDQIAPISAEILFKLGVINQQQLGSLENGAKQWVRADASTDEPIQMWLGKAVAPFNSVYTEGNFGFQEAEEDLELEQLRELEAESGLVDDEDAEMLKGDFFPLSMGLTMPQPSPDAVDQVKRLLDTAKDLYRMPDHLKGPMYLVMQERARAVVRFRLREGAKTYAKLTKQIQVGHWEKDAVYLQKAPIIGMTTTGLSKYRALVSALKPKIILIEEAAEVLEAPVGVACVESLQHLVLVGDHQQLQAHCSVRELEGEPYYLNTSMFERLVRNRMPHKTLLRQRRMDPQFRELIAPVYPELRDHESVLDRPINPWGTGQVRLWWFNHHLQELQDEQMSTYNDHEARMVAKFYRHLIRNGVPAAAITVLTFYNGQRKRILKELKKEPETASIYNKVKTVDSYQGEENHIVILSLVRNNNAGKIGFLDINNRVTVALSRAKFGFYLFGNGEFLAEHNELWDYVFDLMQCKKLVGEALPLTCIKHNKTIWAQYPEDFEDLDGGCRQPCGGTLDCGHRCPMNCHVYPHERILCHLKCGRTLVCGDACEKECQDVCSCDCEAFRMHGELENDPIIKQLDTTPQWQSFAENKLMTENISRVSNGPANTNGRSQRLVEADSDEAGPTGVPYQKSSSWQETTRQNSNGRIRVEQAYPPLEPMTNAFNKLNMDTTQLESRQAIRRGKQREEAQREGPRRQPRGSPAWSLDGAADCADVVDNAAANDDWKKNGWETEEMKPAQDFSKWLDVEEEAVLAQENEAMRADDKYW